jgi:hypothetical protein
MRKGTASAFFGNLRALNAMSADSAGREAIVAQLKEGIPTMRELGLFDMFTFHSPELAEAIGMEP